MTRTGKIARLPRGIRDQLNRRLQNGQSGTKIVVWLNSLPKVKAVLKTDFSNQPISPQNLSEWKTGGYQEWLDQLETKELADHLADEADELNAAGALHTDKIAIWLVGRLMVVVRRLTAANTDDAARWKLLGQAATAFAALRRGDHSAERLRLERDRLDFERGELDPRDLEKLARKWAKDHNHEIRPAQTQEEREQRYREIFGLDDNYNPSAQAKPPDDPSSVQPQAAPAESNQIKLNQTNKFLFREPNPRVKAGIKAASRRSSLNPLRLKDLTPQATPPGWS